jgi:hypothetical protein
MLPDMLMHRGYILGVITVAAECESLQASHLLASSSGSGLNLYLGGAFFKCWREHWLS